MIVAGIMSGTSADGINVAIVRIEDHDFEAKIDFVAHREFPFAPNVRKFILSVMNAEAKVADLARLNVLLGELYAEAFLKTAIEAQAGVSLIGCHGQTIYHQGEKKNFLGHQIAATWQTGEGAILAARTGIPVVSDFRQADMAAGATDVRFREQGGVTLPSRRLCSCPVRAFLASVDDGRALSSNK